MHALLPCYLRMEGSGQQTAGAHCNNSSHPVQGGRVAGVVGIHLRQDLNVRTNPFHPRSADEYRVHRVHTGLSGTEIKALEVQVRLE